MLDASSVVANMLHKLRGKVTLPECCTNVSER